MIIDFDVNFNSVGSRTCQIAERRPYHDVHDVYIVHEMMENKLVVCIQRDVQALQLSRCIVTSRHRLEVAIGVVTSRHRLEVAIGVVMLKRDLNVIVLYQVCCDPKCVE